MIEDQLIELIEAPLEQVGSKFQGGEEFRDPPLDVFALLPAPGSSGPDSAARAERRAWCSWLGSRSILTGLAHRTNDS